MGNTGIRHTGYDIRLDRVCVTLCQHTAALVAHFLDVDALIGGGRITIVYPEEGADFHLLAGRAEGFYTVRCDKCDFCRTKLLVVLIAQIDIGKAFKRNAVSIVLVAEDDRGTSVKVSRGIDTVFGQQEQRHGAVYDFLHIPDTFHA